jgi:hypothetical protein
MSPKLFGNKNESKEEGRPASSFVNEPWYIDLQKLTNEELMRMYTMISDGQYRFAKNAWYIPIEKDHRCPIMVAKGYRSPDTLDRIRQSFWKVTFSILSMHGTLATSLSRTSKRRS